MPSGWFKKDWPFAGHPFVRGFVHFPRLGAMRRVEFLVDTGSAVTTIHPTDSLPMALDFGSLTEGEVVFGIGGSQTEFSERAEISFFHGADVVTYYKDIDIAPVTDYNRGLPSLLGMDIIRHWNMVCDVHNNTLEFEVHHADNVREPGTTP